MAGRNRRPRTEAHEAFVGGDRRPGVASARRSAAGCRTGRRPPTWVTNSVSPSSPPRSCSARAPAMALAIGPPRSAGAQSPRKSPSSSARSRTGSAAHADQGRASPSSRVGMSASARTTSTGDGTQRIGSGSRGRRRRQPRVAFGRRARLTREGRPAAERPLGRHVRIRRTQLQRHPAPGDVRPALKAGGVVERTNPSRRDPSVRPRSSRNRRAASRPRHAKGRRGAPGIQS